MTLPYREGGSVIIVDDFANEITKDSIAIFTRLCHHTNSVVILLTQNIFCQNKAFREISLNATYVVLFKNPRDGSQITCYAKQFAPYKTAWVVEAYEDATRLPHSYVLFDNHQESPHVIRMRSHLLPHEFPPRVYWQGKQY